MWWVIALGVEVLAFVLVIRAAVRNERDVRAEQAEVVKAQADRKARLDDTLGSASVVEDRALTASIKQARRFLPAGGSK